MDNLIETIPGLGWSQIDKRAFEHDGCVVDVGCYMWDWSNSLIGKKRIVGVDPLEENIPNGVEMFKGLLGPFNFELPVTGEGISLSVYNHSDDITLKKSQMLSWKTFCKKFNIGKISILKLNIEGSEYTLLNSMDTDDFNQIDQIAVSFHDWLNPKYKNLTESSLNLLKNSGFKVVSIYEPYGWYLATKE